MMPNDTIELCRVEYDRLVAALNENKDLNEELRLSGEALDKMKAANEKLLEERDSLSDELKALRSLFLDKTKKVEELEDELLFLRGFQEAVHLMCGAKKPY